MTAPSRPSEVTAPQRYSRHLRGRLIVAIAGTAALVFGSVTTFLLVSALEQGKQLARHSLERAEAISDALDREVTSHMFLLRGLATSPALRAEDLKQFYEQLIATPTPVGSWLTLWDAEGQLLNTRWPFGQDGLPAWSGTQGKQAAVRKLREAGYSISDRIHPIGASDHAVAVAVRVDRLAGAREYFVTTVIEEARLRALLQDASLPTDWLIVVFDRKLDWIVTTSEEDQIGPGHPPRRLQQALELKDSGQFLANNGIVGRLLVSFARSKLSGWTVAIKLPLDVVDASWNKAIRNSAMLGTLLLLITAGIAWFMARELEMPLQALNTTVNETEGRLRATADSLLRAEARYETFWRNMPEGLFAVRVTEDGRFVFEGLNPIHERLTGLRQADLADKEPHECLPPEIAGAVTANYRACVRAGEPISYDEALELPGGRRRWHTSLAPVKDPLTGRTYLIVGSARDVTHDRDARDAAERARRLLQRIMDASPDVIYVYNVIGRRFAFISGRVDEVVGYQPEYFRRIDGTRLEKFLHPDDVPGVNEHLASLELLADGEVSGHEFRIIGGDGRYRWLRSKDVAFSRTADGRVAKVVGVARNIDSAKEAQAELEAINGRLSMILASISDCYLTIDNDYRITEINQAALEWLGLRREDAIGGSYLQLRLSSPEHDATVRSVLEQQQAATLEIRSAFNHGRWLDLHFYPTREGASLFFRDVTERKRAEQEAAHTKELLQSSLDALSAHIAILDGSGTIVAVNKAWLKWMQTHGFDDAGIGNSYLAFCGAYLEGFADAQCVLRGLGAILAGGRDTVRAAYRITLKERPFWFQLSAARFDLDGVTKIVVSNEDITDVMQARQALNELSERLLALQEEERQRIAQELHDSTAQHLVAASLNIMSLKTKAQANGGDNRLLDDIETSLEEASKELRVSTYLLHPPNLESDGLRASLHSYVEGFGRRTGLSTLIRAPSKFDNLPISLQRNLLRVIQEALANVHRHADATTVSIDIRMKPHELSVSVSDNGRGIRDVNDANDWRQLQHGLGIPGMKARLHQFGGRLVIETGPQGTTVRARIPLGREENSSLHGTI